MKKTYLLIYVIFTSILYPLNGYSTRKKIPQKIYHPVAEISGEKLLLLMEKYAKQRQYDSVAYYYEKIKESNVSKETLGIAELYISQEKIVEHQYFEAIVSLYTALDYFKKANNTEKEIDVYLKLATLCKKIASRDLSKETDSILMHEYLDKPISKLQKSQILINHASYIATLGKNEKEKTGRIKEAVHLLKSLNLNDFSDHPYVLKYYYEELQKRYTKLKLPDSARVYLNKMYAIPMISSPEDEAMKYIYNAGISYREGKTNTLLKYIDSAKKSPSFKFVEQFELIKLYKMEYVASKKLGKFEDAMNFSVKYLTIRDSIKNFNLNVNASVLNLKLKRDQQIKELKAKNEMNAVIMEEKKKFYIFSTLLASVSVSIFIFLIILHKRRKKRLKLEYENEKMKEFAAIKNNFIENLSHEIRTPITITTGYLQLISNNAMDYSKIVKYSDVTIRNNEQIIKMLNNFLTLLKLEKNPTTQKKTSNKMEAFLKENIFDFQGVAEIKGVSVFYKSNIKPNQLLDYHYEDLRKIINNLISNALKYTNPQKGIYVHTFINKKGLNLAIKDEGIGIDTEDQKRIFDRFYQAKNHTLTGGFGIGLSLVHELVTKLKGSIRVNSKKDIGSVFSIQLPLTLENHSLYVDENSTDYTNICNSDIINTDLSNNLPKILIVDDNIEMIGYLKELLSPTLNCTFAFDGNQALTFANKIHYDIILSDLRMPVMDGHELKVALNTLPNYQTVPYIIMTASAEEYLESNKAEFGINDYIIKPFENIELITRINYHLEKNIYKKQLQSSEKETVTFNGAYADFMEKINKVILENLNNSEFTIEDVATACGYSHKQFTQIVQEQTGLTPVKIILEVRLRKAYELIVTDKYQSISEVLYAVGLNSRSYFNKVFQQRFGLKPGDLIKKLKSENLVQKL